MAETLRIRGGIGADDEFWRALERGEFRLARCTQCRTWLVPAHFRCGTCGSWEIGWEEVEPRGIVYTWTRNHAVSEVVKERRGDVPFVTGLVELPQADGARLPGVLRLPDDKVRIGTPVRGVIEPASERTKGYVTMVWEAAE